MLPHYMGEVFTGKEFLSVKNYIEGAESLFTWFCVYRVVV